MLINKTMQKVQLQRTNFDCFHSQLSRVIFKWTPFRIPLKNHSNERRNIYYCFKKLFPAVKNLTLIDISHELNSKQSIIFQLGNHFPLLQNFFNGEIK